MLAEEAAQAFFATLPDGNYRLTLPEDRPFGHKGSSFVTIREGKMRHRYEDLWCGAGLQGETYRVHRDGKLIWKYPAHVWQAADLIDKWAMLLIQYPNLCTDDILERVQVMC